MTGTGPALTRWGRLELVYLSLCTSLYHVVSELVYLSLCTSLYHTACKMTNSDLYFSPPFYCPLDHMFSPVAFFEGAQALGVEVREIGWLEDQRVPEVIKVRRCRLTSC